MWATLWRISSSRRSGVNMGCFFSQLTMTQTYTLSKQAAARRMMSKCPRVMGSKLPG